MIELLVGTIASGKSTHASRRAAEGCLIVNDDAITTMLHGGDYTLYSPDLKPLYKEIEHTIITKAIIMGRKVVIDRPCLTVATRAYYVALAKRYDTTIQCLIFPFHLPMVHASRRFKHDPRGHTINKWLVLAEEHQRQYEPPSLAEGFTDIIKSQGQSEN